MEREPYDPFPAVGPPRETREGDLEALREAIRAAVDAAGQPTGTWLKVDIYVQSAGDPDVGAYKAIVTPI